MNWDHRGPCARLGSGEGMNPSTGGWRETGRPQGLLARHASGNRELQVQGEILPGK